MSPISPIVVCGPRLRTRTERPSSNLTMMPTRPSTMMHAIGGVALRGDDVVLAHFEPLAAGGELLCEVGTAESLREPFA